ncbi:hypothetical protein [Aquabacterium sp.]|uniref:hypothetical protein n=1 Tax=Aquabacterium sp. TaxID=1872578 RepID=UPI002D184060|nr:hypothetical protein [Aquabacterium sp.]HSW04951.1 hypothetical protein [Aquabacterium sp.]
MALDVGFSRRPPEACDVLGDEHKVLVLSLCGLFIIWNLRIGAFDCGYKSIGCGFQEKNLSVREVDSQPIQPVGFDMRDLAILQLRSDRFCGCRLRWHAAIAEFGGGSGTQRFLDA